MQRQARRPALVMGRLLVGLASISLGACVGSQPPAGSQPPDGSPPAQSQPPTPHISVNQRGVAQRMAFAAHATSKDDSASVSAKTRNDGGKNSQK